MKKKIIQVSSFLILLKLISCDMQQNENQSEPNKDGILSIVDEFNNRPIHKELTEEILDSIPDDKLEQAIFDNILLVIDNDNELEIVQQLTKGQQAVYSTWLVEGEVNNGGFNQFYFNSSGQFREMAVNGFATIGAEEFADLMKRANNLYLSIKDEMDEYDDGTLESFSESYEGNPLNDLDAEFYNLNEDEKLSKLKIRYIRNNTEEFIKR